MRIKVISTVSITMWQFSFTFAFVSYLFHQKQPFTCVLLNICSEKFHKDHGKHQKQSSEGVLEKSCHWKFCKINRKTPVLFLRPSTLLKRDSSTVVSLRVLKFFKNTFTEHLPAIASGTPVIEFFRKAISFNLN